MKTNRFVTAALLVIAALSLVLAACQAAATPANGLTAQETANLAVVQKFYDEFNAGNLDVILEVHPETITMHYEGGVDVGTAQQLRDDLAVVKNGNPDLHAEVVSMIASGDLVMTQLVWVSTHTGDYFGFPADGHTTQHPGIVVRRLEGGKIVESWEAWNDLTFLNSLELVPTWDDLVAKANAN